MLEQNKLPIGLLLNKAGLISAEQLENALQMQKQYSQMKLGEILVLQQGLRVKTIDFFVERWQEILAQGKILPLGYYLEQAGLLNDWQIKIILHDRKTEESKFGELAIEKGWIEQDTLNFFLENLSSHQPKIICLSRLETYNSQSLHLEKKYANYSLILSRILAWTGGIPVLTQTICQVFAESNSNIPDGQEIKAVDRFVEGTLIKKWRESKAASSIRAIAYSLVNNPRCSSNLLLKEYQSILLSGEKDVDRSSKEQQELLLLGLIVEESDRVQISNIIYQQIFDRDFVAKQLTKTKPKNIKLQKTEVVNSSSDIKPEDTKVTDSQLNTKPINSKDTKVINSSLYIKPANTIIEYKPQPNIKQPTSLTVDRVDLQPKIVDNSTERSSDFKANTPEPLTKIGSIIIGVAIALLIPLFLRINSYYSSLSNAEKTVGDSQQIDLLQQSCNRLNPTDLPSLLNLISDLELDRQQLQQDFPNNCQVALNRLRVMAAPQLGKQSRILEAIRHLCKVPSESEMYIEAEVWLTRWYRSADWGRETKSYLEETDKYNKEGCPAGHFTEYES